MLSLGLNRDLLYPIREQQQQGKLDGATVFTADRWYRRPGRRPAFAGSARPAIPAGHRVEARIAVDAMPNGTQT